MRWGWIAFLVFLAAVVGGYYCGLRGRLADQRAAREERRASPMPAPASGPSPAAADFAELPSDNRSRPDSLPRLGAR